MLLLQVIVSVFLSTVFMYETNKDGGDVNSTEATFMSYLSSYKKPSVVPCQSKEIDVVQKAVMLLIDFYNVFICSTIVLAEFECKVRVPRV